MLWNKRERDGDENEIMLEKRMREKAAYVFNFKIK